MSGSVCLIADQSSRYTVFHQCLTALYASLPPGTVVDWEIGADRGRSRNTLVRRALERKSDWVFFLDDDHSFPANILDVLLSRNVSVVASLYLQRSDPFLPIAFAEKDEEGQYWPLDLNACPEHGLVTVVGAGTGGMLIKTEVFNQVADPWFIHTTQQSEDLYFCDRLAEAGIQLYVDLDARLGHIGPVAIYPDFEEGQWAAGLAVSVSMKVLLPINMPGEDQDPGPETELVLVSPETAANAHVNGAGLAPASTPLEPRDREFLSGQPNPETGPAPYSGTATRVEMYPDAEGRWYARGVTETGLVVDRQDGVFNQEDAEILARNRWPGLDIYIVADANGDSTFVPTDQMRMGIGQPDRSARAALNRIYGNR